MPEMVKVQAIIREERLDAVVARLVLVGIGGLTVSPVKGSSHGVAYRAVFRGASYPVPFVSKLLIDWYGTERDAEHVARAIVVAAGTGNIGDGVVFIEPLEGAVRIRTGERDLDAL